MENLEHDEQETPETPSKRFRRKSVRRQLQEVVTKLGKVADDAQQKSAKRTDALLKQADLLLRLQTADADEAETKLQDENERLTAQHAADAEKIATLEAQNNELHRAANQVKTVTVLDPEHSKTRQQSEALRAVVSFLSTQVNREQTAIRAIQQLSSDAASIICDAVGIKVDDYRQYLQNYRSERDFLNVIEKAQVDDSSLLRFVRAALVVTHSLNPTSPQPKSAARLHSVHEELIERERQENADREATKDLAWRRQMGL
jgi:hypothetical protein